MSILIFLAVLLVLIIVHEFGHFIVAKRAGIRVDEFGIGFPPKLFGIKKGETEYTLNALPFGGFVRIFGENPDDPLLQGPDSDRALVRKPKLVQAAVLFAGVFFNVLLAWILFSGTLMTGTPAVAGEHEKYISNEKLLVTHVLPDTPASRTELRAGDAILSLSSGGSSIQPESPEEASAFIRAHHGESILLAFERDGVMFAAPLIPETGLIEESPETPAIGIGMGRVGELRLPFHLALLEGGEQTLSMLYRITLGIGTFLFDALLLQADLSTVAGPVGIVGLVGNASALGIVALLNFTAIISLNLAVINLIPFPALDGGRLLFLCIEALKGSPIKPKVAAAWNTAGFALLVLLMLVVTYSDILRLFG
ncbi:site-2 protease family protein [Candidatus Kaiserbacteria bacterium]|nr:site-2 protease family protein [Candidatus Kaiserbacteria bacterium]